MATKAQSSVKTAQARHFSSYPEKLEAVETLNNKLCILDEQVTSLGHQVKSADEKIERLLAPDDASEIPEKVPCHCQGVNSYDAFLIGLALGVWVTFGVVMYYRLRRTGFLIVE